MRSQFATSSWGGLRYFPMAFTEHGALMISSVLKNDKAVQVNIQIMRVFIKFRAMLSAHKDLDRCLSVKICLPRSSDKFIRLWRMVLGCPTNDIQHTANRPHQLVILPIHPYFSHKDKKISYIILQIINL